MIRKRINKTKKQKSFKSKIYQYLKIFRAKDQAKLLLEECITFVKSRQFKCRR